MFEDEKVDVQQSVMEERGGYLWVHFCGVFSPGIAEIHRVD